MSQSKEFLLSRGWSTWYSENYWVHPESVEDPKSQDYTNYGMSLEDAVKYENLGRPKHKPLGMSGLSQLQLAVDTCGLTKKPTTEGS